MPTIDTGQNRQQGVKNFIKIMENWGDINANETKLKVSLMANEIEKRQNWFYKMQEQKAERENKLKMFDLLQEKIKNAGQGGGMGAGEEGLPNINAPQIEVSASGEPTFRQPSIAEQKMKVKKIWYDIDKLQANNKPLSNLQKEFMQKYPKEVWIGEEKEATQKQVIDLAIKLAQSESGGFASQEDIKKQIPVAQQMLLGTDFSSPEEKSTNQYTPDQERLIQDNMNFYKKPREETIQALTNRGLLK